MRFTPFIAAAAAFTALAACDAEQTQEGELPDVDVNATGGELPAYDVDTPDVDVNTTETEVQTPELTTETETVEVPTVDVQE